MLNIKADSLTLGFLGKALSSEMSAVQQYSTQAKLVHAWGFPEIAMKLANEATEEMAHADRIIGRMIALSVAPNASQLTPVRLGSNVLELLQHNHQLENEIIVLYTQAVQHCRAVGDIDNTMFFEGLLAEEHSHANALLEWITQLKQPKLDGFS